MNYQDRESTEVIPLGRQLGRPPTNIALVLTQKEQPMFMQTKIHHALGKTYTTKVTMNRKNEFEEFISCCDCKVFYIDEHLFWVNADGDFDNNGVPYCRVCYENKYFKMAA